MPGDATTTSAGLPRATSAAKVGPERNASRSGGTPGSVSASTSDMSLRVRSSMPLVATTTSAFGASAAASPVATARRCCDGGTRITTSAPLTTADASVDASMVDGQRHVGQIGAVAVAARDVLGDLGLERPHAYAVADARRVAGQRRSPRPRADDRDLCHAQPPGL